MSKGKIGKSIVDMIEELRKTRGAYEAKRLERAADEVPNLERRYSDEALRQAFLSNPTGELRAGLVTMNPQDFEKYAASLPRPLTQESIDNINKLSKLRKGFSDVPFMEMEPAKYKGANVAISGHEGRHRSMALEKRGDASSLVRVFPDRFLIDRKLAQTNEELIEQMRKALGENRLVVPQQESGKPLRDVIQFPEVYKSGGPVNMQDGGDPVREAIEQAKRQGVARDRIPLSKSQAFEFHKRPIEQSLSKTAKTIEEMRRALGMPERPVESADEGAAFGVYPQLTGSARRHREAMAGPRNEQPNPLRIARGVVTGSVGQLGDLEKLGRTLLPGVSEDPFLPTTEKVSEYLPFKAETEVEKRAEEVGNLFGDVAYLKAPFLLAKGAKSAGKALAPKAGELAEQYMMRTGMALPMAEMSSKGRKVDPIRAEREAAMERAKINAVKMLGLPENNTAMDRARAMGYEPESELYHGSLHDIKKVNLNKGDPSAFAGQGFYMTPDPKDASRNYASIYGPDVAGKIERGIEYTDKDLRRIQKAFSKKTITPARAETVLRETGAGENLGVVYPLMVKRGSEANMAQRGRSALIDAGEYYDEATDSYIEGPMAQAWRDVMETFKHYGVEPPDDIYELMSRQSTLDEVWDAVAKSKGRLDAYDPDTGDLITKEGLASQVVKDLGANTVTHPTEFRNPDLNIAGEHTIAIQPSGIVRSRFAAFDPAEADSPDLLKKKGGPVSLDAMRLAVGGMAGGGIKPTKLGIAKTIVEGIKKKYDALEKAKEAEKSYTTPAAFQRAPAKTKQEIEAIAQRMAPQFLGEFVRKPGKTESVAGKSFKQYKAEQDLPIVYGGARDIPKTVDIESRLGDVMIGVPGDPTIAHRTLEQVGDIKPEIPVELHGGPLYGLKDKFWASDLGAASGLRNLAGRASRAYGDTNVLGQYIRMPEGTPYALHTTDALLSFLRPDMLGKKKLEQLNAEIRRGGAKSKYSFPEFVGFEDIDLALMQAQGNPELRKHINNTLLAPTTTKKYGLYPGKNIEAAITEEPLRNVETGTTGYSIGRLFPEQALTESAHPTYAMDIPGLFLGQTKYPQPYELTFPDTLKYVRENLVPGATEFGTFKMVGPRQIIDPQYVDEIKMYEEAMKKLTGKKKGGPVHKATGGMASAPLKMMRAFVEAGKKAKLAEKSKEAVTKGEVYIPDEESKRAMREALNTPEKPEEYADGGAATVNEAMLRRASRLGKVEKPVSIPPGQLARGWAAGTIGLPGDIESIGRAIIPGVSEETFLPTSEQMLEKIPGKSDTEIGQRAAQIGTLFGGAGAGRIANAIRYLPTDVMKAAMAAYGPQATASHVIKPKGGNWLAGDVEGRLKRLKSDLTPLNYDQIVQSQGAEIAEKMLAAQKNLPYYKRAESLNKWIDKQLTRYIKNEMGTSEDPIRALAEKGTLHYAPQTGYSVAPDLRRAAGMPEGNVATTELGKAWENIADKAILPGTYKTHAPFIMKPGYYSSASEFQDVEKGLREIGGEFAVKNPDAPAYAMNKGVGMEDTGFQHIIDELKNATNPDSGLPRELQLRPESLERLSVPQAVERVAKINEWRAAQKAEADLARANNPATTTFKEYPEGYAWKELKMPEGAEDNKALADALKYEGEQMGHCVGGYCPDVESGQSRIYSLRDEKGVPHVTIEVAPPSIDDYVAANQSDPYRPALDTIVQIKGRGNAKPAEKYLPFVQDFVKSGNWSDIRDFQNTGLVRIDPESDLAAKIKAAGAEAQNYVTQDELTNLLKQYGNQGNMKKGGRVKSAPSLDAMRLAVMSK